ncbi:hypothetical protein [Ruminococcus sp.]
MTENLHADCVQSRQAGFMQRFLKIDPQFFSNKNIPKMSTLQLEKSIKSWQAEIKGRGDSNE